MNNDYKAYIRSLARHQQDVVFFNSGKEHAAMVLATIFENAKSDVKIYAGSFSGEVSDTPIYREGLQQYLSAGGKVKILLQDYKLKKNENPAIFDLLRYYSVLNPSQIEIKTHPYFVAGKDGQTEMHFTVADNRMYRLEEDVAKFKATCNFNDVATSKKLTNLFDTIFAGDEAQPVKL